MSANVSSVWARIAMAGALVAFASTASGCKSLLKKKLQGADAGVTTTAAATPQDLADEQLQEKLDEYIKCLNSLAAPINQSRRRYLTYVPKTGPKGNEPFADLYKLSPGTTASCSAGMVRSKTMPPSDPRLESVGTEFAAAATDVDQLMNDAENYFEMKSFRDDKWAKGKAMHPKLIASWDRFSKAEKNLHDTLDGITKPMAQRVLARIDREEGKKFRYGRKKALMTSRELVEAADPAGDDDDVDFNLYAATYTDFEKALDELVAYGNLHKAELSNPPHGPNWPAADSNYDAFVKDATEFKKASKEFWRCLRDAPTKAKTPSGKLDVSKMGNCTDGPAWKEADAVVTKYNTFIRTSNAHQFP